MTIPGSWNIELNCKPDFERCMQRIYAWYDQEIIDRPPIRFSAHNAEYSVSPHLKKMWSSLKERWFDSEYQVDLFIDSIKDKKFYAETFPVFWPNLGPEVYTAFHGSELEYMEVTSYSVPVVKNPGDIKHIRFDKNNPYFRKIEEMTLLALDKCDGKYLVGYTDLHPGMDCVAAWTDPQQLCIDLLVNPDMVRELIRLANLNFQEVFDYFDNLLKLHNHLSVTWMGIPSYGKMHIPSSDFSAMISSELYLEFVHPITVSEVKPMTHNVYHVDGKGVARHLSHILEIKEINAIQWVQGMGYDTPIMQWVPLIKKIQAAGKSVVLDIQVSELEDFIDAVDPEGIMLCISAGENIQPDIIRRIEKW
ncbi:MAG: hypothetical protein IPN67_06065 [Bacteroidales bacterium]|nr:hypothetical protein [Bacteroidales bacterium]